MPYTQRTQPLRSLAEDNLRVGYQLRESVLSEPDGTHRLIQLGNVRDGVIDMSDLPRMSLEAKRAVEGRAGLARVQPYHYLQQGDVLLRSRGATYGAALALDAPANTVVMAPLFRLRVNSKIVPEYLVWFINRPATQAMLRSVEGGTYIPSISVQSFSDLPIVVPPMAAQRQIAEIDRLAREERALNARFIEKREQEVNLYLEQLVNK